MPTTAAVTGESVSAFSKALPWISGAATPLALDYRMNSDKDAIPGISTFKDIVHGNMGKDRAFNLGFNSLLGGLGGKLMGKGNAVEGMGLIALAPAKDLLLNAQELPSQTSDLIKNMETNNKLGRWGLAAGAIGGLGLLGLGGYVLPKLISKLNKPEQGHIKIKMPGKKGDPETTAEVELPINMPKFSPTLIEGLDKAVRLRARKNIRANSYKKDPNTGRLIPFEEWEEKYGRHGEYIKHESSPYSEEILEEQSKAASSREWMEGAGSVGTSLGTGALGALLGAAIGKDPYDNKKSTYGAVIGGIAGLLGPSLIGAAAGKMMGKRTEEEQEEHDARQGAMDVMIPGVAAYNSARRNSDVKAKAIEQVSREAVGDAEFNEDEYTDSDPYEWEEKEASFWGGVVNRFYKVADAPPPPSGDPNQQQSMVPQGTPMPPPANPGGPNVPADPNNQSQEAFASTAQSNNVQKTTGSVNQMLAGMDRITAAANRVTAPQPPVTV